MAKNILFKDYDYLTNLSNNPINDVTVTNQEYDIANSNSLKNIEYENNFLKAFSVFYKLPNNILIHQSSILEVAKHVVEIFYLLGYFNSEKLWQDIHLFGKAKGSQLCFFNKPNLVFSEIYKLCQASCIHDAHFNSDYFINNFFNCNTIKLKDIFSHNINLNTKSAYEDNLVIMQHLLLYWFQSAFNRKFGQERFELLANEAQANDGTNKLYSLNEHFKALGFINTIEPSDNYYKYICITGSSFEGMELIFSNTINNILPKLVDVSDVYIQTGDRNMGLVDSSVLMQGVASINYAKNAMLTIAKFKNIELNPDKPFLESFNDAGTLLSLQPNFSFVGDAYFGLKETDIAKYFVYDKYNKSFVNYNVVVIDTHNDLGADRPNTYTTAVQNFLEILAKFLINSEFVNAEEFNQKILVITAGAPFIQRQGLTEIRAFNDVLDKLIDMVHNTHFCNPKNFGECVLAGLSTKQPPSQIIEFIKNISIINKFSSFNEYSNNSVFNILSKIKSQFSIEPVGSGIEDLNYHHAIKIILSEFGAKFWEHYYVNNGEPQIAVGFQMRENSNDLVPEYPTEDQLIGCLGQLENAFE